MENKTETKDYLKEAHKIRLVCIFSWNFTKESVERVGSARNGMIKHD